jgi:N-acylneuraminate cytidylyltransferase
MGKPLIAWTLEAVTGAADYFSRFVVATDDETVKSVVRFVAGSNTYVPWEIFDLTPEQAGDTAGMLTAVKAVIDADDIIYDGICVLPPTAPLRDSIMIRQGMNYWEGGCRRLMLGARYNLPPWQALWRDGGEWKPVWGRKNLLKRSQEVPELMCDAGAMYVIRPEDLDEGFYGEGLQLLEIPTTRAADIDDYQSLVFATTLWRGIA